MSGGSTKAKAAADLQTNGEGTLHCTVLFKTMMRQPITCTIAALLGRDASQYVYRAGRGCLGRGGGREGKKGEVKLVIFQLRLCSGSKLLCP